MSIRSSCAATLAASLPATATLTLLLAGGCSPYPDDGEFLAGVVYAGNFIAGVKTIAQLPAVGRGAGPLPYAPYAIVATSSGSSSTGTVSNAAPATAPFWTNGGKRQPLSRSSAAPVYVFDSSCSSPPDYSFDDRLDLLRLDRQFPIFSDLPEVLPNSGGKAGRSGAYSAIVEVIHVTASGRLPCQSIKRFDTAQNRVGDGGDLSEVGREYRLFQIIDPAIAVAPLPYQLGFFNQLIVPYVDMGPVPLDPDGQTFRTMPLYKFTDSKGNTPWVVTLGQAAEAGPAYSPICRDFTLPYVATMTGPVDANDPLLRLAVKTESLSSCLVCRTTDAMGGIDCPFASSQVGR
jgi:hypothetical protein